MLEDMQDAEIATRRQQDTKPVTTVPEGHASLLTTCMIYWARSSVTWWIVVMPNAFEWITIVRKWQNAGQAKRFQAIILVEYIVTYWTLTNFLSRKKQVICFINMQFAPTRTRYNISCFSDQPFYPSYNIWSKNEKGWVQTLSSNANCAWDYQLHINTLNIE